MYDFAPEETRFLVFDDCSDAIRLSFCGFIFIVWVLQNAETGDRSASMVRTSYIPPHRAGFFMDCGKPVWD
jgi:hypothetical protein